MMTGNTNLRRRDSTPLLERIRVDLARMKSESEDKQEEKDKKPKKQTPVMKYIKCQVLVMIVMISLLNPAAQLQQLKSSCW